MERLKGRKAQAGPTKETKKNKKGAVWMMALRPLLRQSVLLVLCSVLFNQPLPSVINPCSQDHPRSTSNQTAPRVFTPRHG